MLLSRYGSIAAQIQNAVPAFVLGEFELYEPPLAADTWVTDETGRVLDMTDAQFLAAFYDGFIGTQSDGMVVTKTSLGKEQSNTYDIYEYDFCPANHNASKPTFLISSGMHTIELPASFGLAHFMTHLMTTPYLHDGFRYIRENVRIKVIPIINPWGFNQNPKSYPNSRGVNPNRNFDWDGAWAAYPDLPESEYDYKGTAPFSEKETQILRDWALANSTAEFWIDCHTGVNLVTPYTSWVIGVSNDPIVPYVYDVAERQTLRFIEKYNSTTPLLNIDLDNENSIKHKYVYNAVGLSIITIEFNNFWGTALNNEGLDITEYEFLIASHVFRFLSSVVVNNTTSDTFSRPNNTIMGYTEVGNKVWTNQYFKINHGYAQAVNTNVVSATYDPGFSNIDAKLDVEWRAYTGLLFRYTNDTNCWMARINSTSLTLYKYANSGTGTLVGTYAFTPEVGSFHSINVVANADSIKVYMDGIERITATDNFNQTATKVGIKSSSDNTSKYHRITVSQVA